MEFSALNLLYDIAWMSALMLIAKVIRSKISFIQKLYIPSALIAGFMGLLAGWKTIFECDSVQLRNFKLCRHFNCFCLWFDVYW